jgi:hypothetical protein
VVIGAAVNADGHREILRMNVIASEDSDGVEQKDERGGRTPPHELRVPGQTLLRRISLSRSLVAPPAVSGGRVPSAGRRRL